MQKNHPKLVADFRVLQFPACAAAFQAPVDTEITGMKATPSADATNQRTFMTFATASTDILVELGARRRVARAPW
jgi:hypothetical protein